MSKVIKYAAALLLYASSVTSNIAQNSWMTLCITKTTDVSATAAAGQNAEHPVLYTTLKLHQDLGGFILIHSVLHTQTSTDINHGKVEMNKKKVHSEQFAANCM